MKRIIITITALIFIQVSAIGKCYQVFKRQGQVNPDGTTTYEKVIEDPEPVGGKYRLDCNTPGTLTCKYKDGYTPPIIINGNPVDINEAMDIVDTQVTAGIFSGIVEGDNGIGFYSWNAVNSNDYEIEFCDGN